MSDDQFVQQPTDTTIADKQPEFVIRLVLLKGLIAEFVVFERFTTIFGFRQSQHSDSAEQRGLAVVTRSDCIGSWSQHAAAAGRFHAKCHAFRA